MIEDYKQSESWKRQGNNFLIEVKRYTQQTTNYWGGKHRWNVYAYIYPKHPHFAKFDGTEKMWQATNGGEFDYDSFREAIDAMMRKLEIND